MMAGELITKAMQNDIARANEEHVKATDTAIHAMEAKQAAIGHAIQCGKALLRAKRKAGHGSWEGLFSGGNLSSEEQKNERFGFSKVKAARYMKLAKFPALARQALRDDSGERFNLDRTYAALSDASAEEERKMKNNHRAKGTGQNEWHTPEEFLAAARLVLGSFDLDPASSALANKVVQAERFFTVDDDGLSKDWFGTVWMNPPYSQPQIEQFAQKLVDEYGCGNVESAIALTHNYTDTAWFHLLAYACDAICFTKGRIGFINADGETASPTQGQSFFYFGNDVESFFEVFNQIGVICIRHER